MTHRVLKYSATVYYASTGSSSTGLYPFTEAHAAEAGTVLETDGIPLAAAIKLCEKWTKRGNHGDIRYTYHVPFAQRKGE